MFFFTGKIGEPLDCFIITIIIIITHVIDNKQKTEYKLQVIHSTKKKTHVIALKVTTHNIIYTEGTGDDEDEDELVLLADVDVSSSRAFAAASTFVVVTMIQSMRTIMYVSEVLIYFGS